MRATKKAALKLRDELINKCYHAGIGFRVIGHFDESDSKDIAIKLDKKEPNDEVIEINGAMIFLDPESAAILEDCELDYLSHGDAGFSIKEPPQRRTHHEQNSKKPNEKAKYTLKTGV